MSRKDKVKKMEKDLEEIEEIDEEEEEDEIDESDFGEPVIKVDGSEVILDISNELEIGNLSEDQSKVAAQMAYWSSIYSAAESEKLSIDAYYRRWRAQMGSAILKRDSKIAEWKAKQLIEADKKFIQFKVNLALATKNSILAKGVFESFKIKANALQSKGAQQRAELDATGMTTKMKDRSSRDKFGKKK